MGQSAANMMAGLVAAVILSSGAMAADGKCAALVHLAAAHDSSGYEGFTPGLGVVCERGDLIGAAGVFSNSERSTSTYAVAGWQPLQVGPVRIGAVAGLIDGYQNQNNGRHFPVAALIASVPVGSVVLRFMVTPKHRTSPMTVGVAFSF